eukprot:tig00020571_g11488.t1
MERATGRESAVHVHHRARIVPELALAEPVASVVTLDDAAPSISAHAHGLQPRGRARRHSDVDRRTRSPAGLATSTADALGLAPVEEESASRAFWRLVRGALEHTPAPPPPPPAPPAGSGSARWANARALLLVVAGPALAAAVQFGLPYHSIPHRLARVHVFGVLGSLGPASSASVWFALLLHAPLRRVVPSYVALFTLLGPCFFTTVNALVDLSTVPFGYVTNLLNILVTNQICARVHARVLARRSAAAVFAPVDPEAGGGAAPAASPPRPARGLATFGKFQLVNMSIMFVLFGLCVRVFRQFAFFRVQSLAVYAASLASDLVTLLLPSSLLARRVARPFARAAAALLRRLSAAPAVVPAPAPAPAPAAAAASVDTAVPRPDESSAAAAACAGGAEENGAEGVNAGPGVVSVRSLDGSPPPPSPGPEAEADPDLEEAGEEGRAERAERAQLERELEGPPLDEDLWVYNVQTGIRSMLLWHAVISWAATSVFVAAVLVARWGPGAASFPYSPATFDGAACTTALAFSLLSAGLNGAAVAAIHALTRLFPSMRDRFALAASWRFLREHAATLALTFSSGSSVAFLILYRQANLYFFVFPESYPPDA